MDYSWLPSCVCSRATIIIIMNNGFYFILYTIMNFYEFANGIPNGLNATRYYGRRDATPPMSRAKHTDNIPHTQGIAALHVSCLIAFLCFGHKSVFRRIRWNRELCCQFQMKRVSQCVTVDFSGKNCGILVVSASLHRRNDHIVVTFEHLNAQHYQICFIAIWIKRINLNLYFQSNNFRCQFSERKKENEWIIDLK